MSNDLVSIGMPIYNAGEDLRTAIDALLAQTYTNFELIISDNASTDGITRLIAEEYAQRDSRIRFICQPTNLGAYANFVFVLQQARGKYFMWAAHDDGWAKNYVEVLATSLDESAEAILATASTSVAKTTRNGTIKQITIPAPPNSDRWTQIDSFTRYAACVWIYGLYRTKWLQAAAPELKLYPMEESDVIWLFGVLLRERIVGNSATTFHYTAGPQKRKKTFRYRMTISHVSFYHLANQVRKHLPALERFKGYHRASKIVFRFHMTRGNVIGTAVHIAKVSMFAMIFAMESGVRRLVRSNRPPGLQSS